MHFFNSPPSWPPPPSPDWRPPPGWRPDPSWAPAPKGWRFWVNERGGRTLGPQGLYGAVGRGRLAAGGAATVTLPGATVTLPRATVTVRPKPLPRATVTATSTGTVQPRRTTEAPSEVSYDNCSEARAAGVTPLHRGDPGYASHLDRDDDGIACE